MLTLRIVEPENRGVVGRASTSLPRVDGPISITTIRNGAAYPRADSYEVGGEFVIRLDVPGAARGDVKLSYDRGSLTVTWNKDSNAAGAAGNERYLVRETFTGIFTRTFALPKASDASGISAEVKDGVMTIRVPKHQHRVGERFEIAVS